MALATLTPEQREGGPGQGPRGSWGPVEPAGRHRQRRGHRAGGPGPRRVRPGGQEDEGLPAGEGAARLRLAKTSALLAEAGIARDRRVAGLGSRQREALVSALS